MDKHSESARPNDAPRARLLRAHAREHRRGSWRRAARAPSALKRKRIKRDRHKAHQGGVFPLLLLRPAFKFFVEQVLDADYLALPRSHQAHDRGGSPKLQRLRVHALQAHPRRFHRRAQAGANVLVQFGGPCRLGYYGELQESILRDMGYEFDMLNFSAGIEEGAIGWAKQCLRLVNPDIAIPYAVKQLAATASMAVKLDEARDFYLANAGFETQRGAFERAWATFMDEMRGATCDSGHQRGVRPRHGPHARHRNRQARRPHPHRRCRRDVHGHRRAQQPVPRP